MKTGM